MFFHSSSRFNVQRAAGLSLLFFHYSPLLLDDYRVFRRSLSPFFYLAGDIFFIGFNVICKTCHLAPIQNGVSLSGSLAEGKRTLLGIIFSQHRDVVYSVNVGLSDYSVDSVAFCSRRHLAGVAIYPLETLQFSEHLQ